MPGLSKTRIYMLIEESPWARASASPPSWVTYTHPVNSLIRGLEHILGIAWHDPEIPKENRPQEY